MRKTALRRITRLLDEQRSRREQTKLNYERIAAEVDARIARYFAEDKAACQERGDMEPVSTRSPEEQAEATDQLKQLNHEVIENDPLAKRWFDQQQERSRR